MTAQGMAVSTAAHVHTKASMHPLGKVRASRGWSYQQTARIIARRAREMGVQMAAERQKIWRWEHRGVVPDQVSQRALAAVLGIPAEHVAQHSWPNWLPSVDVRPCIQEIAVLRDCLALAVRTIDLIVQDHESAMTARLAAEARAVILHDVGDLFACADPADGPRTGFA